MCVLVKTGETAFMLSRDTGLSSPCGVFIWFGDQGDIGLMK